MDQFSSPTSVSQEPNPGYPSTPPFKAERVVSVLMGYWDDAQKMGDQVRGQTDRVVESYNQILPYKVRTSKAIQTKAHLGWTNRAIKALKARIVPLLMPGPKDFFNLYDSSLNYSDATAVVSCLLEALFDKADIEERTRDAVQTWGLEGAVGADLDWDAAAEADDPLHTPAFRITTLNARDISIFPVTEPRERCITGIRTYLTKHELIAQAMADPSESWNPQALQDLPDKKDPYTETNNRGLRHSNSKTYGRKLGVEVIDFYAPTLVVDDQEYSRVFATVVDGKHLVRFAVAQKNSESYVPPVFAIMEKLYVQNIGPVRVGVGICHGAYDLEMAAITLNNLNIDNAKDNVRPPRTYDPNDAYFDKDQTSFSPGELIASSSQNPNHLKPLTDSARIMPSIQEQMMALQNQFESAVGIPDFLTGNVGNDDKRVSATAKRLEANGSDTRVREYASTFNDQFLEPLTQKAYVKIERRLNRELQNFTQMMQMEQQTGQRPDGDPYQMFPLMRLASSLSPADFKAWLSKGTPIPPLSAVSLDLTTFESALEKVDEINNTERALATLGQVHAVAPELLAGVGLPAMIRNYLVGLNLGGTLKPESEADQEQAQMQEQTQAQQQQQQAFQQALQQAEIQKQQVEIQKLAAEVAKIQAETSQTTYETAHLALTPPEPKEKTSGSK